MVLLPIEGNTVLVREGYKNAEALLAHAGEVVPELPELFSISGEACHIDIFGPEAELEKLKEPLKRRNIRYFALDQHSTTFLKSLYGAAVNDDHVTIAPYFKVSLFFLLNVPDRLPLRLD